MHNVNLADTDTISRAHIQSTESTVTIEELDGGELEPNQTFTLTAELTIRINDSKGLYTERGSWMLKLGDSATSDGLRVTKSGDYLSITYPDGSTEGRSLSGIGDIETITCTLTANANIGQKVRIQSSGVGPAAQTQFPQIVSPGAGDIYDWVGNIEAYPN